jgi:hypothetical protein
VNGPVRVACVQAEPVIMNREATLDRLAALTAEAKANGAQLVVFPETFIPAYPSSAWAKFLAGWADPRAKGAFAQLARESVEVPGPAADRLGAIARENEVWLVTGVNERDPSRSSTLYNALLYHAPDGSLALHHRKLVPTNHERLIWGQGDGGGLRALPTELGRIGGLICWENYMPLARFALYESGSTSHRQPTTETPGRPRSSTSPASPARSSSLPPTSSAARHTPRTSRCARRSPRSTHWGGAARPSSARTAPISRGLSTARKGSSTPTSIRPGSTRSGNASIRRVTTTGPTYSRYGSPRSGSETHEPLFSPADPGSTSTGHGTVTDDTWNQ